SIPFTGSGTEEAVARTARADVQNFYQTWFKPGNAVLIIVGDTTLSEMTPKLEKMLSGWMAGSVPKKNIGSVQNEAKSVVYLMDRPGSIQSMIFAGDIAPPKSNPHEIAIETMNSILGGTFTSRINMNLREGKHWSYGARAVLSSARGQRPFIVIAPVQTDKTKESVVEVQKELEGILGKQPITEEELAKAQKDQTLKLTGAWETSSRVMSSAAEIIRFGLPEDYFKTYPDKVLSLKLPDVTAAAGEVIHLKNLVWVIVGDREKIEPGLRELGLGEIRLIDTDGKPVKEAASLK
ncbi:MAG: pitrilysin family protein, partial [Verrucomicrobiota bacterium]